MFNFAQREERKEEVVACSLFVSHTTENWSLPPLHFVVLHHPGSGNRFAVVQFDVAASVLCPMTWNQTFLLNCIAGITFPAVHGGPKGVPATIALLPIQRGLFPFCSPKNGVCHSSLCVHTWFGSTLEGTVPVDLCHCNGRCLWLPVLTALALPLPLA